MGIPHALHELNTRFSYVLLNRVGWDTFLSSTPYTDRFRAYRKNVHGLLGSKWAVARFYPLQDVEVRRFLFRVLNKPDDLLQHIRTCVIFLP